MQRNLLHAIGPTCSASTIPPPATWAAVRCGVDERQSLSTRGYRPVVSGSRCHINEHLLARRPPPPTSPDPVGMNGKSKSLPRRRHATTGLLPKSMLLLWQPARQRHDMAAPTLGYGLACRYRQHAGSLVTVLA